MAQKKEGTQLPLEERTKAVNADIQESLKRNQIKIVFRPVIAPNGTLTAVAELQEDIPTEETEEPKQAETA